MENAFSNGTSLFRKRRRVNEQAPFHPSNPQETYSDLSRPTTAIRSNESPKKSHHRRDSSLSSLSELGSTLRRRSASLRSKRTKSPTFWENITLTTHTEKLSTSNMRPTLAVNTLSSQPSTESMATLDRTLSRPALYSADVKSSRGTQAGYGLRREDSSFKPSTGSGTVNGGSRSTSAGTTQAVGASQDARASSRRVYDAVAKRISLLQYLRMIYASETHWFNTYRFTPAQIRSLPSMHPLRLARRTQSLLLLGLSLPFVLDPNRDSLPDYLRAFSALLSEFDSYTTLHPPEGGSSSALSRARIPQMFKRAPTKGRRGSSADALLTSPHSAQEDPRSAGSSGSSGLPVSATWTSFPAVTQEHDLLPGEEYQYLLTPSLPFDADYFETFATLCEVLSECYRHITGLLDKQMADSNEKDGGGVNWSGVADLFGKVDAKVKKIILAGLVREFEDASKQGIRSELAGVGKLVLGGLV